MNSLLIFFLVFFAFIAFVIHRARKGKRERAARAAFIESYPFPPELRFKLDQVYPHLSHEQTTMVFEGLRTWFRMINQHQRANFGMPSVAVDTAWHEFILLTQKYADFCQKAFGKFLHHAPTNGDHKIKRDGLARTYGLGAATTVGTVGTLGVVGLAGAAALSGRDLFSLDQTLGIPGGNAFAPDAIEDLQHRYANLTVSSGSSDSGGSSSSSGDGTWGGDGKSDGSSGCESGGGSGSSDGGSSDGGGSGCGGGGGGC